VRTPRIPAADVALFAGLAALAFYLRAAPLPVRFPYNDDLMQLHIVCRPSWDAFLRALVQLWPMPPPLDYALGFLAARATSDLQTLRLLPAAYGTLAVLVACALGRNAHGRAFGAWWGFLLAISMPLISTSQSLRPYSLTVLLALSSSYALLASSGPGPGWGFAAASSAFQAAYPHAAVFAACQWASAENGRRTTVAKALLPSALVFGGWLAAGRLSVSPGGTPPYTVTAGDLALVASVFNQGSASVALFYVPLAVLGCAAAWRSRRRELRLAASLLGFGFPAIVLLHVLARGPVAPRHLIALLPVYLALVAAGTTALDVSLRSWIARHRPALSGLVVPALGTGLFLVSAGPISLLYERESRLTGAFRESLETLRRGAAAGEPVVFSSPNVGAAVLWSLDREAFLRLEGIQMADGFAHFRFPKDFTADWGSPRPVYTLCASCPGLATAGALEGAATRVWWVSMEGFNSRPEADPFPPLRDVPRERVSQPAPGVFVVEPAAVSAPDD
jgi:hypothetical protein